MLTRQRQHRRLTDTVTRDPRTGQVRRGAIVVSSAALCRCPALVCHVHPSSKTCGMRVAGRSITLRLPKRLEPPNVWLWAGWPTKRRAKRAWAALITRTACEQLGRLTIADLASPASALGWTVPTVRARVDVVRHVARGRGITDPDNLTFAAKGLLDCLVQAGFLRDDKATDIDLRVAQVPSVDGLDLTVVTIAPLPAASGVPHAQ